MHDTLDRAVNALDGARRILVFTGAGISTESGIPDFRGPEGIWTKVDPDDFTIDRYLESSEIRQRSWAMWGDSQYMAAEPNRGHAAIVTLWEHDLLAGCVTQNIDGLHLEAGLPCHAVAELHGNTRAVTCLECEARWETGDVLARVAEGDPDPHCPHCAGIIKLTVVSFGQMLPQREMMKAQAMADAADAVIAVGTTLSVWPAAEIPLIAARKGAPFVIINQGETEFDHAAIKVEAGAGDALTAITSRLTA
ncbi:MAG: Sir2 family NAD-dependent protein deacetylase [Acidimicrobiia bacterium]|nr:Sir2 family NAD-dependent protein deacetylase [Acidimicrobiia bacterium]